MSIFYVFTQETRLRVMRVEARSSDEAIEAAKNPVIRPVEDTVTETSQHVVDTRLEFMP